MYQRAFKDLFEGTMVFCPCLAVIQGSECNCGDAEERRRDLRRKRALELSRKCADEKDEQDKQRCLPRESAPSAAGERGGAS